MSWYCIWLLVKVYKSEIWALTLDFHGANHTTDTIIQDICFKENRVSRHGVHCKKKKQECGIQLHIMHNNVKVAQFSLLDKANDSKIKEHPSWFSLRMATSGRVPIPTSVKTKFKRILGDARSRHFYVGSN